MMPFVPDRSDARRAMAILVVGILVLTAVAYVPVLRPWWQTEYRLWALRKDIESTRSIQAKAADIDRALRAARERVLARGTYLPEPTEALANAALTLRIQDAVSASVTDDSVCLLGNRAPIKLVRKDHCVETRVRVELQCGTTSLEQVLRTLETQPPRLRIDRLELDLAPNPLGFDKPFDGNQPIRASFEVAGCMIPPSIAGGDASGVSAP